MRKRSIRDEDAPQDLVDIIGDATVVVFRSELTDTRTLLRWLQRRDVEHCEITMGMASEKERERFRRLRVWTGWQLLPQVFIEGEFIGGADEFFEHPFTRERDRER